MIFTSEVLLPNKLNLKQGVSHNLTCHSKSNDDDERELGLGIYDSHGNMHKCFIECEFDMVFTMSNYTR